MAIKEEGCHFQVPLQQLDALYRKCTEVSHHARIVINSLGQIILFNAQAELMFGYARNDILGEKIEVLIPEHTRERHVQLRDGYVMQPRIRQMGEGLVLQGLHSNGKEFAIEIYLAPVVVDGLGVCTQAEISKVKSAA
jgi:protein-histidine pros-kinase